MVDTRGDWGGMTEIEPAHVCKIEMCARSGRINGTGV